MNRTPTVPPLQPTLDVARQFRDVIDRQCTKNVCAVCSMIVRQVDIEEMTVSSIPNLDLLRKGREDGEEDVYPRAGLTVWGNWCLQPAAIRAIDVPEGHQGCDMDIDLEVDAEGHVADICKTCLKELGKGKVPDRSLVAFDTGEMEGLGETDISSDGDMLCRRDTIASCAIVDGRGKSSRVQQGAQTAVPYEALWSPRKTLACACHRFAKCQPRGG